MIDDEEQRYRAISARDPRFDGWFFLGVTSTGIYCRPSCPARTPARANVRYYPSAAAAQSAGFRACKRCRPDASPGSPEWNVRADVVGRAMRLIGDGTVDREGVSGLAARLGYSERQLHRLLVAELGTGPLALARAQRAQTARVLLETTAMPAAEVAFAAGFSSVRQFNDTVRAVFAVPPTVLRSRAAGRRDGTAPGGPGWIALRLPYRAPIDLGALFDYLSARAVPGVEEMTSASTYRRVVGLPHGTGVVELTCPGGMQRSDDDASTPVPALDPGYVQCHLRLSDLRDLPAAVHRCRRLLDLDADPQGVAAALGGDPLLGPLVAARPGLRAPGSVDAEEVAVRAVVGQQVSLAGARTIAGRLAAWYGTALEAPDGTLTTAFPSSEQLAGADPQDWPMPSSRRRALLAVASAAASGALDLGPGADRDAAEAALLALPGVGPWTAGYVRLRALADPDVFLPGDLGVRRALAALGQPDTSREADRRARGWAPWRSYAMQHLWSVPTRSQPGDSNALDGASARRAGMTGTAGPAPRVSRTKVSV